MAGKGKDKAGAAPGPLRSFVSRHKAFTAVSLAALAMFSAGTVFLGSGVSSYVESGRESVIIAGLDTLSHGKIPEAKNFFIKAATDGDPLALAYLSWIECSRGDFKQASEHAVEAMRRHGGKYVYEIAGDLAILGYGSAKGAAAAESYFSKAADGLPADRRAEAARGIYERALELCQSFEDYKVLVSDACDRNAPHGLLRCGDMEFLGEGQVLSPKSAYMSWTSAADAGLVEGTVRAAAAKWYGYGMERDMQAAYGMFKTAAQKGDPVANYDMGLITLRSNSPAAIKRGFEYLHKSADLGYGPAISAVAILSLDAGTDKEGLKNAYRLFRRAYRAGDHTGSLFYAFMTYSGIGGADPDHDRAFSIMYEVHRDSGRRTSSFYEYLLSGMKGADEMAVLKQMVSLCASQLYGEMSFDDGDPAAAAYKQKHVMDSGIYYRPLSGDPSVSAEDRERFGNSCAGSIKKPGTVLVGGKPLISQSFAEVLEMYNPTSGAKRFEPAAVTGFKPALPELPSEYDHYKIDLQALNAKLGVKGLANTPKSE
jgi:TPR repeat protein